MSSRKVEINHLRLRASGLTREQARRLGEVVAKRLRDLPLQAKQSGIISTMKLSVRSSWTNSIDRMAEEIAVKIRRSVD